MHVYVYVCGNVLMYANVQTACLCANMCTTCDCVCVRENLLANVYDAEGIKIFALLGDSKFSCL